MIGHQLYYLRICLANLHKIGKFAKIVLLSRSFFTIIFDPTYDNSNFIFIQNLNLPYFNSILRIINDLFKMPILNQPPLTPKFGYRKVHIFH